MARRTAQPLGEASHGGSILAGLNLSRPEGLNKGALCLTALLKGLQQAFKNAFAKPLTKGLLKRIGTPTKDRSAFERQLRRP